MQPKSKDTVNGVDLSGDMKNTIDHEEMLKSNENHAFAVMPDSLRSLSIEERLSIEQRIVRKLDIVIL